MSTMSLVRSRDAVCRWPCLFILMSARCRSLLSVGVIILPLKQIMLFDKTVFSRSLRRVYSLVTFDSMSVDCNVWSLDLIEVKFIISITPIPPAVIDLMCSSTSIRFGLVGKNGRDFDSFGGNNSICWIRTDAKCSQNRPINLTYYYCSLDLGHDMSCLACKRYESTDRAGTDLH